MQDLYSTYAGAYGHVKALYLNLLRKDEEVTDTMHDLRTAGVDILTIGQYLRPSKKQMEVVEYCSADRFAIS